MRAFWDRTACCLVVSLSLAVDRRFRAVYCLHHQGDEPDDSMHLRNVGQLQQDYTALYPRGLSSSTDQIVHRDMTLHKITDLDSEFVP
jgi:hypothetical protein